jgi:hypothetical protein
MSVIPTSSGRGQPAEESSHLVEVVLVITDEQGETQTSHPEIESGPTKVTALKAELGIPEDSALWIIQHGKKKPLGDHETFDVTSGDHFEAIVRGGVS